MIEKYKEHAEVMRGISGRAPNVTKHYFPRDEVLRVLEQSRNYKEACEEMGLLANVKSSSRAYANLQKIAKWYGIDLNSYLVKGGKRSELVVEGEMSRYKFIHQVLVVSDKRIRSDYLKKKLFKYNIKERICEKCGCDETWYNEHLNLEVHHVNGQLRDNRIENLRILCPNCRSQASMRKRWKE